MASDSTGPKRTLASRTVESLAWIVASLLLCYFISVPQAIAARTATASFALTIAGMLGFLAVFLYLQYYLVYFKQTKIDYTRWETQAPRSIQIATASGLVASIALVVLLWPAYSIGAPVVAFVIFMGIISLISLF